MAQKLETITAYVSSDQKQSFLAIKRKLDKKIRLPQTALAQFAITKFIDSYFDDIDQLAFDLGN